MKKERVPNGFSLVESLVALGMGAVFISSVFGAWYATSKAWKEQTVKSQLYYGLDVAIERMKQDIRLSDSGKILYNPSGSAGPYSAMSIPSGTLDANSLRTFSSGSIVWNRTVLYHLYNNGGVYELRRTVYPSYNSNTTARQAQLDNVVTNGGDTGSAVTTTLCTADSLTLAINSSNSVFDGYAAALTRSAQTDFGSIRLASGAHTVTFKVTGKNAASGGYRLGVDSISLSPSGGTQEAEVLTVGASSGQAATDVDMSGSGGWGGNQYVDFAATAADHYLTFNTSYDQWLESNFGNMTHSNTSVTGADPRLAVMSREDQSLSALWQAQTQAAGASELEETVVGQKSYRTVIGGAKLSKPVHMVRVKFRSASASPLVIESAYIGVRNPGTGNFAGAPTRLYFDNAAVAEGGSDPAGSIAAPGVNAGPVTVPAGHHLWSNWIEYTIGSVPAGSDLLVSYCASGGSGQIVWEDTTTFPEPELSYSVDGDAASSLADWSTLAGYAASKRVCAVEELGGWNRAGVASSQVYDTRMTAPVYGNIDWTATAPAGSTIAFKVRASANQDMSGASDWSALSSYAVSGASLGSVANNRYVQFQVSLTAASPYATMPSVDDVKIAWPGQTSLVSVGGRFAKKSNYGTFQVLVDGNALVKAITVSITAAKNFKGRVFTEAVSAELRAQNTGK